MMSIFYVYEHWRSDTNVCFYVGKGHGKRAFEMRKRNQWHQKIRNFLVDNGYAIIVKIIASDLSEQDAFQMEMDTIIRRKADGDRLVNMTLGGDGVHGHRHSAKTCARLSEISSRQHRPCLEETKEKIRAAQIGKPRGPNPAHSERMKGRKLTDEHKLAISLGNRGKTIPAEIREKIRLSNTGRQCTDVTRQRLSQSHLGKSLSLDQRKKISEANLKRWAIRRQMEREADG